ncbi:hypothetical protein MMC25_005815 [Agyrium rufum]|nr:hypothetical protein [Agyrium rufum]
MKSLCSAKSFLNLPFLLPSSPSLLPLISRRHESTIRRTVKKLKPAPDTAIARIYRERKINPPTNDHIVFHPPPTTPNPHHTPAIFLPPDDPRRKILSKTHQHENPYAATVTAPDGTRVKPRELPPPIRPVNKKKYHLMEADIAEIRRLRTEDPFVWTRLKLAEKYDCSPYIVGLIVSANEQRLEQSRLAMEAIKARWGPRKRAAMEDRKKRRAMWGRDE